ncbi:hypothetical protein [Rudaea sp.]|uniref:hypothetical protein n=1 Tax=Rudaea sp. TaxID=2136325 RepID=UPI003784C17F
MNSEATEANGRLTWQAVFAKTSRAPFTRLADFTSHDQERITRIVYPAAWAVDYFVDNELTNPRVAVVGVTQPIMAAFDGALLPVFTRVCRSAASWTINAPAAPKPRRAQFNALNLVKRPTILRQETRAALDKIADTADVLMVHSTYGLDHAREIVEWPAFDRYTQDGKYVLWGADSEVGIGSVIRWLVARGYDTDPIVRGPFEGANAPRMPSGLIYWVRVLSRATAVTPIACAKADADIQRIMKLWTAMQAAVPQDHRCAVADVIGTVCEQTIKGRPIRALMASPFHLVDLESGEYCDRDIDGEWVVRDGKLPATALALFPEEDTGDPSGLRVRRMSWLQAAMDECPPEVPSAREDAEQPHVSVRQDKLGEEIQPLKEYQMPRPEMARAVRGKGTWPVLAVNAQIGQPRADPEHIVQQAVKIVCAWLADRKKIRVDENAATFSANDVSEEVTIEADGARLWAMRLDDRRGMTEGAFWRVEMILAAQPQAQMALRIEQIRLNASAPPPQPAVPAFVIDLADKVGLHDGGRLLRAKPWEIISAGDIDRCVKELMDPLRAHPVLVASYSNEAERMRQIAGVLAKRLAGVATVAWLDHETVAQFKMQIGASFAVYGNAVRLYQPGLARTDNPFTHPVISVGRDSTSDKQLVDRITQEACAWAIEPSNLDVAVPTFPDARRSIIARRVSSALDATQRSARTAQESIERLQQLVAEQNASLETNEAQVRERTREVTDLRLEIAMLTRERDEAIDELRRERYKSAYQWKVTPHEDVVDSVEPEWPERWDDLQSWIELYGQNRLVLHPMAVKTASNSPFRDIAFAYKVLHLLVNAYIPMKTRAPNDEAPRLRCEERCKQLGVDISPVGTAVENQRYANRYRRKFGDKVLTMDMHVSRGGGFDPTTVFRCYFTYDADNQRVLVGHLPGYLENTLTHTS